MPYKNRQDNIDSCKRRYKRNKQSYIKRNSLAAARNKKFVDKVKTKYGCQKCGYKGKPICFDFHHLKNKTERVGRLVSRSYSINRIKEEIRKCILLCANCHRIEHKQEYKGTKQIRFSYRVKRRFPCAICSLNTEAACYDFHHLNPKEKDNCVANLVYGQYSLARIKKEMRKCILLCSNCHRNKH